MPQGGTPGWAPPDEEPIRRRIELLSASVGVRIQQRFAHVQQHFPDVRSDALLHELRGYQAQLQRLQDLLAKSDGAGLTTMFATARSARNDWLARQS